MQFFGILLADWLQIGILAVLLLTCFIAYNQLNKFTTQQKETYFWSKKKLALIELDKTRNGIEEALLIIEKHFQFSQRDCKNPITSEEIHKVICESYNGGKCKKLSEEGADVRRRIAEFLGKYEYIATGVNTDMFDRDVVERLVKTPSINAYRIFEPYIRHLREDHHRPLVFKQLEELVVKFEDHKDTSVKPKYTK